MKKLIALFLMSLCLQADTFTGTVNSTSKRLNDTLLLSDDPATGLLIDTGLVMAGLTVWGATQWNWGSESFHFQNEAWFDRSSKTGGSDKTGHFYMTYLLSRVMASRMQDRGLSLEESSLYGSLSALTAMAFLETGDGTSPYGFSKEDFIADSVSALVAYLIRTHPKIDEYIDIRFEYLPLNDSSGRSDLTTDYSNMRHLVAFKAMGFDALKQTPLSLLELQVGYYSRGYRSYDTVEESQHIYIGIGISLADLARRSEINVLKNVFEFYQPGHTYVETDLWSRP